MTPLLEARRLCRSFTDFALQDVDLEVEPGSILGLVGPNGAGKTTLMRLIIGQLAPSGGHLAVCGLTYPRHLKEIRSRIGYVPEDPPFQLRKRVREVIRFASPYYPRWDANRCGELLERFGIVPERRIEALSRGQRSLLSLTLALAHGAQLLLLDEPATGLDVRRRRQILRMLAEFVADGHGAAVIATHQTDGLAPLADRFAFLHRGRLILAEQTEQLLAAWKWVRYRDGALSRDLEQLLVCREAGATGKRGLLGHYLEVRDRLTAGQNNGDIQIANASVDDILIALTSRSS